MNICIIAPFYPTISGEGGYFFVEQLVLCFADLGHKCTVIAPINLASKFGIKRAYGPYYEQRKTENGNSINVYRPRFYGRDLTLMGVQWSANSSRCAVERVIKKHHLQIDVIYAHFFRSAVSAWYYASTHQVPLFVATGESTIPQLVKPCRSFSLNKFREQLTGVICVSTKNKDEALKLNFTTNDKCIVLPNGVDINRFKPLDKSMCRKILGLAESDFIVICVGNYTERKGQNRIVNAVEKISNPSIKIILGGRGNEIFDSKSIVYKGFVAHEQIPLYLNASDVYVIPTRWEGCCNSIIEAMACGLPIISSDKSFNWDILNKENSILINPDKEDEIANAITKLYKNKSLRRQFGDKSYEKAQGLSINERANRIISFIESQILPQCYKN